MVSRLLALLRGAVACLAMAATLVACSSPTSTVRDSSTVDLGSGCSLGGAFHVTFAPAADSPPACACSQCSYDVAAGHIDDVLGLAQANDEYFLGPLLAPDAGAAPFGTGSCGSTETSPCAQNGSCSFLDGHFSSAFTFTVTNGAASGTQSFVVTGSAPVNCTYDVTASPAP